MSASPQLETGLQTIIPTAAATLPATPPKRTRFQPDSTTFAGIRKQVELLQRRRSLPLEEKRELRQVLALKLEVLRNERDDLYKQRDQARADRREEREDRAEARKQEMLRVLKSLDALPPEFSVMEVLADDGILPSASERMPELTVSSEVKR